MTYDPNTPSDPYPHEANGLESRLLMYKLVDSSPDSRFEDFPADVNQQVPSRTVDQFHEMKRNLKPPTPWEVAYNKYRKAADLGYPEGCNTPGEMEKFDTRIRSLKSRYEELLKASKLPTPLTRTLVTETLHSDLVTKSRKGVWKTYRGFFYSGGYTSEKYAEKVKTAFPQVTVLAHGTEHKRFKGGAGVESNSHLWVEFTE